MPDKPNNPFQFWEELKRRRVVRVIPVYAAAAFVILELVDILSEPLGLPDWTINLVLILLCIGFVISVILSWVYDVTPEGIEKTKPLKEVTSVEAQPASKGWKIATFVSVLIIIAFIVFYIVGNNKKSYDLSKLEKSIAVLPLDYLSEDLNKQYLANGVLDAITGHLSMIEGLRVMPRTSVEQYRENTKSAKEIGEELDVSYLIEGSFFMIDNQVKLTIQLVVANEGDHVFFKEYNRDYEDIFIVQSEVAQTIAKEIETAITPEEKQLIEKVPTTSLMAYDFYQQGKDEHFHYGHDNDNKAALERAEELYKKALEYDSAFALAYTGLARIYWDKSFWETFFTESFLDSVLILAEKAISIDPKLSDAYSVKGDYYSVYGQYELAIKEYDHAININPNDWIAYLGSGEIYYDSDIVKGIDNMFKAAYLHRGPELPELFRIIGSYFLGAGFNDKFKYYQLEALKLDRDSVTYFITMAKSGFFQKNFRKSIEYGERALVIDSNNPEALMILGGNYYALRQIDIAIQFYQKWLHRLKELGQLNTAMMHRVAYAYWLGGFEEEAEYYFDEQIEYDTRMNELGRKEAKSKYTYYDLAGVYAFRGEKEKAFENLRIFNQRQIMPYWMVFFIKNDSLFNSIRDESEFQQIVRDVESKYQAEHERVRQWLEENDML